MTRLATLTLLLVATTAHADEVYQQALAALKYPLTPMRVRVVETVVAQGWPEGAEELRAVTLTNARAIHLLRRAAGDKPRSFPIDMEQGLGAPMPHLGLSLRLAQIALLEARRLQASGDHVGAAELCVKVAAFGQDVGRAAPLVGRWTGARIQDTAASILGDLAPEVVADEKRRKAGRGKRVVDALGLVLQRDPSLLESARIEKRMMLASLRLVLAAMAKDDKTALAAAGFHPDRDPGHQRIVDVIFARRKAPLAQWPLVKRYEALIAACKRPLREIRDDPVLAVPMGKGADELTKRTWPGVRAAVLGAESGRTRLLLARVGLAVAEARLKGAKSHALSALLKDVLSPVPDDPFTGYPFRHIALEKGFVVYSYGPDGADDQATRECAAGGELGDLALWVPGSTRFVWRALEPALKRMRRRKRLKWVRWDERRPHLVFIIATDHITVGNARTGRLRKYSRRLLGLRPFKVRDIAFGPGNVWLATSRALLRYDPRRRKWRRCPVMNLAAPDCLAVRLPDKHTLAVLVGPKSAPRSLRLELGSRSWLESSREAAEIWVRSLPAAAQR